MLMNTTGSRVVDQDLQLSHSGGLTDRSERSLMTPAVPANRGRPVNY